jgi:cellobiose-specific phosphotransferase system component IIB
MRANIDQIAPTRSLIDLSSHSEGDFGIRDYELSFIFDDILLVEYIDSTNDGDGVMRNGIYVPSNALAKAWRKARVILAGPDVKYTKVGDIVIFPNNLGVTVSNIDIENIGPVKSGVFLNENRIFGICKPKNKDDIEGSIGAEVTE